MRALYRKIDAADAVIFASPIFFTTITAQAKMFADRFQCRWVKKHLLKTAPHNIRECKGAFLCASGIEREDFFENAKRIVKALFSSVGIRYAADIYCGGIDNKGAILKQKEMLKNWLAISQDPVFMQNQFTATKSRANVNALSKHLKTMM